MEAQHADVGYSNVSIYKLIASQEFKARLMDRFYRKASLFPFINSCGRSFMSAAQLYLLVEFYFYVGTGVVEYTYLITRPSGVCFPIKWEILYLHIS